MDPRPTIQPRLVVADADAAIDFYARALDADLVDRVAGPGGGIVHAELAIGQSTIALKDADDHDPVTDPGPLLTLAVDDAHTVAGRLEEAGATVVFAVADHGYGYLDGRLVDPFGVQWLVSQPLGD